MVGIRDYPSPKVDPWTPNAVLDEAGGLTFHDPKGLELTSEIVVEYMTLWDNEGLSVNVVLN